MGGNIKYLFTVNKEEGRGYPRIVYAQLARPQTIFLLTKTSLKSLTEQDLIHTFKTKKPHLMKHSVFTCPITSNGRWKELHWGQRVAVLNALPLREWIRANFSGFELDTSKANVELVICSLILCWTSKVLLLLTNRYV